MSKDSSIEDILGNSYTEPIDLSTIHNEIFQNKDDILYDLLNITHPDFNLRNEFNTISIFFDTNNIKYPEFKKLLTEYVNNFNNQQSIEKAIDLKAIIMQFIADKMNNRK